MTQAISLSYAIALLVTLWATALGSGLAYRPTEIAAAAANRGRFVRIIVLDAVVLPLLVYVLVAALKVPEGYAAGLILVGAASAGAIGLAVVRMARADVPLAVGLVVVLEVGNLLTIPLWSAVLLRESVRPPLGDVVVTLVLGVLVPLLLGVMLRRLRPTSSGPWAVILGRVAAIGFVIVVAIAVGRDFGDVVEVAGSVSIAAVITVAAAFAGGWIVGYPGQASRRTGSLVTAVRANTPALAVASSTYGASSDAAIAIVVFALISLMVSGLAALVFARSSSTSVIQSPTATG